MLPIPFQDLGATLDIRFCVIDGDVDTLLLWKNIKENHLALDIQRDEVTLFDRRICIQGSNYQLCKNVYAPGVRQLCMVPIPAFHCSPHALAYPSDPNAALDHTAVETTQALIGNRVLE